MPTALLARFAGDDQGKPAKAARKADGTWIETLKGELSKSDVAVTAVLSEMVTDVERLARLKPGEVLELPSSLDSAVRVMSGGEHLFDAKLGRQGDRMVLYVSDGLEAGAGAGPEGRRA
jgi:flagellar motor switch protein FliM